MKKLIALLAACLLIAGIAGPVMAAPTFAFTTGQYQQDDAGADDEPGQKDLTAQAAGTSSGVFYTSWKWDDTAWSGGNTGDGCSLFDTNDDDLVDYALCATVSGGKGPAPVTLTSFILYSCNDTRADRCAGPTQEFSALASGTGAADADTYCRIDDLGAGQFGGTDTIITCDITAIAAAGGITGLDDGTLLNTCSYPSREPNSDPSDCVLTEFPDDTGTVTTPTGSVTSFSVSLTDTAQVTPAAPGSVAFTLWSDAGCTVQVFAGSDATDANGEASVTTSVSVADTYYWTADFTPTDPTAFNPSESACGSEIITVTAPTVAVPTP